MAVAVYSSNAMYDHEVIQICVRLNIAAKVRRCATVLADRCAASRFVGAASRAPV